VEESVSDRTGEIYRKHHESGGRYGFTMAGDARGGWFRDRIAAVSRALSKPTLDLLDIGCRDGTLTKQYGSGHHVVGLDVDVEAVRRANAAGIDARAQDLNRDALTFPDASFDVVVAGEVLEHLQWPEAVVRDIHRVLRPNGRFFGTVPNAFRLRNRVLFFLGRDFEVDPTHLHWFSPASMRKLLVDFREVDIEFHGGHRRNLHPELLATQMHWSALR
jgi:SAM-dependent methyltransferase